MIVDDNVSTSETILAGGNFENVPIGEIWRMVRKVKFGGLSRRRNLEDGPEGEMWRQTDRSRAAIFCEMRLIEID